MTTVTRYELQEEVPVVAEGQPYETPDTLRRGAILVSEADYDELQQERDQIKKEHDVALRKQDELAAIIIASNIPTQKVIREVIYPKVKELKEQLDQLKKAAQQAAEVMEQAAGAPGEDWLEWQLKLADTLAALEHVGIRP